MVFVTGLIYNFDGALWTLRFTGVACEAFFHTNGGRLSFYYFEDFSGTDIYACSASSAFIYIYFYLNQIDHPLRFQ